MSLDTLRPFAQHLFGAADHTYAQLVDIYRICKEDPISCWDDPLIRRPIAFLASVLFCLCCISASYLSLTSKSRRERTLKVENDEKDQRRIILQKLLVVITPTRSIWSEYYWQLAHKASKSQLFSLPVQTLMDDLIKGDIEIRDPTASLSDLITGRVVIEGLRVELKSDHTLRRRVIFAGINTYAARKVRCSTLKKDHCLNADRMHLE